MPRRTLLVVTGLSLIAAFVSIAQVEVRLGSYPKAVEKEPCVLPGPIRSTVGHFLVRFVIETAGTVGQVEPLYAALEPPESQPAVEKAIRECMSRWRYKNVRFASGALTAFHFFRPTPPDAKTVQVSESAWLSIDQIEEMRRAKVEFARHLMSGEEYAEYIGGWWSLRTDMGKRGLWEFRDEVEFALRAFRSLFPGTDTTTDGEAMTMLVFGEQEDYTQVAMFDNLFPRYETDAGHYSRWDQMVYTVVGGKPLTLVGRILAHEAAHHLLSQAFWSSERPLPRWVNEGVASFIECLHRGRKEIQLQKLDRKQHRKGMYGWSPAAEHYIRNLQALRRDGALPPLRELLDGEMTGQLVGGSPVAYGFSWLTVHFLVNGAEGAYRDGFRRWLADSDAGTDLASLEAALGKPVEELEKELHLHLKRL